MDHPLSDTGSFPTWAADSAEIVKAHDRDIGYLIDLHRECFPKALLYQMPPGHGKRWWRFLLTSNAVEVYILTCHGMRVGSAVLITDPEEYERQKRAHRVTLGGRLLGIMRHPRVLAGRLRPARYPALPLPANGEPFAGINAAEKNCWINPIAIAEGYRNKGFGRHVLTFLESRSVAIGKKNISLHVNPRNPAALHFYQACGYKRIGVISRGWVTFKKALSIR